MPKQHTVKKEFAEAVANADWSAFEQACDRAQLKWRHSGGPAMVREKTKLAKRKWRERNGEPPETRRARASAPPEDARSELWVWPDGFGVAPAAAKQGGGLTLPPARRRREAVIDALLSILPKQRVDTGVRAHDKTAVLNDSVQRDGDGAPRVVARELSAVGAAELYHLTDADRTRLEKAGVARLGEILLELPTEPSDAGPPSGKVQADPFWTYREVGALDYQEGRRPGGSIRGKDVTVAVLDTGVTPEAAAQLRRAGRRLRAFRVFDRNTIVEESDDSDLGHGTGVLGIVAQTAPAADLLSYNIVAQIHGEWRISSRRFVNALNHCVEDCPLNHNLVVNLSFGRRDAWRDFGVMRALDTAARFNAFISACSGNNSRRNGVCWPSMEEPIVCVGAHDGDLAPCPCSNYCTGNAAGARTEPEIAAHGVDVATLDKAGERRVATGTSAATPLLSGAAALLWEENPALSTHALRAEVATRVVPRTACDEFGHGALDLVRGAPKTRYAPPPVWRV